MTTFLLIWIFCMPEKSLSHRSNPTPAGHPASPSGTEPFERGPGSAGGPPGARRSGTEPPVSAKGAERCRRALKDRHFQQQTCTLTCTRQQVTPRLTHLGAQAEWERVNKTRSSPPSQCLVTFCSPLFSFLVSQRKEVVHSFLNAFLPSMFR